MTTHDLASDLRALAEQLEAREDVRLSQSASFTFYNWGADREECLALAAVFPRPYDKQYSGTDLVLSTKMPRGLLVYANFPRDKVCRKVQDEKWECEPLLTQQEVDEL